MKKTNTLYSSLIITIVFVTTSLSVPRSPKTKDAHLAVIAQQIEITRQQIAAHIQQRQHDAKTLTSKQRALQACLPNAFIANSLIYYFVRKPAAKEAHLTENRLGNLTESFESFKQNINNTDKEKTCSTLNRFRNAITCMNAPFHDGSPNTLSETTTKPLLEAINRAAESFAHEYTY